MSKLSRRRSKDSPQESRQIFYGDVPVGWIGVRSGVPTKAHQWGWKCGFYPGMEAGQHRDGSATSFKLARRHFLSVWRQILPTLDGAAFEAYRQGRTNVDVAHRRDREGGGGPSAAKPDRRGA
jgi:hypothetical protein